MLHFDYDADELFDEDFGSSLPSLYPRALRTLRNSQKKNRLEYEYEPEIDELAGMSECEMERYFNVHLDESSLECMVDRITKRATRKSDAKAMDPYTQRVIASYLFSIIYQLLYKHHLTIHDAEAELHMRITEKTLVKWVTQESYDYGSFPIYQMIVSQLPAIIERKTGYSQEDLREHIAALNERLSSVDSEISTESARCDILRSKYSKVLKAKRTMESKAKTQVINRLLELFEETDKLPFGIRNLFSRYHNKKNACRELLSGVQQIYQLWQQSRNDDVSGQLYFNIGFNVSYNTPKQRADVIFGSKLLAAIEYICLLHKYIMNDIGGVLRYYVGFGTERSTIDPNSVIYDTDSAIAAIQSAVENYIVTGDPVCIVLRIGYVVTLQHIASIPTYDNSYMGYCNIRDLLHPIICAIGIERFEKGPEYIGFRYDVENNKLKEYTDAVSMAYAELEQSRHKLSSLKAEKYTLPHEISRLKDMLVE